MKYKWTNCTELSEIFKIVKKICNIFETNNVVELHVFLNVPAAEGFLPVLGGVNIIIEHTKWQVK